MRNFRKPFISALSFALAFVMAFGFSQPIQAVAEGGNTLPIGASGEIVAFEELAPDVANMTVPLGTPETDLALPDTVAATVLLPEVATPSDSGGKEIDVDVPVSWKALGGYIGEVPGDYVFIAEIGGDYTVSAELPEITVTVSDAVASTFTQATSGSIDKFLAPIDPPVAGSIPIATRAELETIRDNLSGNYHLTANIDLSGAEWVPIGDNSTDANSIRQRFTGILDGQGYAISNMEISGDYLYAGLFGFVGTEGTIKNVGMEDVNINIYGTASSSLSYRYCAGAIGGRTLFTTIINCYSTGSVYSSADSVSVGGICGYIYEGTIAYCYNMSNVSAVSAKHSGSGDSLETYAGGLCGDGSFVPIEKCYNTGNVSASSTDGDYLASSFAGGICNRSIVRNCYNTGYIYALSSNSPRGGSSAGGIAADASTISNCYNIGVVSAFNEDISLSGGASMGGISGEDPSGFGETGTVSNSYCLNLYGSILGTQLTDTEMRVQSSFENWDFDTVWTMPSDGGYPILQWQEDDGEDGGEDGGDEDELYIKDVTSITNEVITNESMAYICMASLLTAPLRQR